MATIVQKFGGTSVGSLERIEAVAEQIIATKGQGHDIIVVLSAMSGETNRLMSLANAIDEQPSPRELDMLLSSGEQVSISLLAMALIKRGHSAVSLLAHQIGLKTNNRFNKARIQDIDNYRIIKELQQGHIVIVAGFQGVDEEGNITTLGRGGSDTSAVAIATSVNAKECQIYTDVDGVYTTDPRIDESAKKHSHIGFDEMLEMASSGAKVLQSRSVEFARNHNMPLRVLSSFSKGTGTRIDFEQQKDKKHPVSAITADNNQALIKIEKIKPNNHFSVAILNELAKADIEIDMLSQLAGSDGALSIYFSVNEVDYQQSLALSMAVANNYGHDSVIGQQDLVKVSAIGNGMKSHSGVAATLVQTLNNENIKIELIYAAEIKIAVLVSNKLMEQSVTKLHKIFNLNSIN
ncbi:aspartate kinase [Thalassotalea crassostreae]|uniref:aspartate kinase n=1 Tax=Thalassotalea crassostreae TaxID=1763536 RepID=UPI000838810A|nr:aspartate kinase [Thalassotalea crassostreae]